MPDHKHDYEGLWYWYLTGQHQSGFSARYERQIKLIRAYARLFPGQPRCVECDRPLLGWGSRLSRTRASSFSPRLCHDCESAMRQEEAGAEVELSLLFADVRGSTGLAENRSTADYKQLFQRFYQAAGEVLIEHNALVNRLMGDEVIGLFVPRFAGAGHARAVAAARDCCASRGMPTRPARGSRWALAVTPAWCMWGRWVQKAG